MREYFFIHLHGRNPWGGRQRGWHPPEVGDKGVLHASIPSHSSALHTVNLSVDTIWTGEHLCSHSLPIIRLSHQACVNSLTSPALQLIAPSLFCPVGNGMVSHQNMLMMPNSNICVTQKSRTWCFTLDKLDSPFALVSDHGISHYNDIAPNVNLCVQLAILAKFQ